MKDLDLGGGEELLVKGPCGLVPPKMTVKVAYE